jgi:type II secretory pathway predicted ATPase ExeA
MVTGPYGVGKTFLLSCLVRRTQKLKLPLIRFDAIPNGGLPMARHILRQIGVEDDVPTLADALMRLQQHCMDGARGLSRHVLLLDEAQYLADGDGLYLVHFLCNLRIRSSNGEKPLFTTVLSGTPALARSVDGYESLRRRIQLAWTLDPLSREQTIEYVQQHVRAAGGDIWAFSREALDAVHRYSGGIPRSINNLCDTALMLGYAAGAHAVTPDIVREAAEDTGLAPRAPDAAAPILDPAT